jgi:hypothetical protein
VNEDNLKDFLNKKQRYFKLRLETTWEVYLRADKEVSEAQQALIDNIYGGKLDSNSKEVKEARRKLEDWYPEVLREAMLFMFCSLIEEVLRDITETCIRNYEDAIKHENGSWLKRHLCVLEKAKGIDVDKDDVKFFQHFIELRNCVTHGGGNVNRSRNKTKVRAAISYLQQYGNVHNFDMLGEWEDGYLQLGEQFLSEVHIRGEDILDVIFKNLQE